MAHFKIVLQDNLLADVRSGVIEKTHTSILSLLRFKPLIREAFNGYIIKIYHKSAENDLYQLMKTKEGKWLQNGEHSWIKEADEELTPVIKLAIDEFETNQKDS